MEKNSYAYAETLDVLENMSEIYINKIPKKLIQYLKENASKNYEKHIVPYKALAKQNLNRKTLAILAMINLKYWAKSEEHKQFLIRKSKNINKSEYHYNNDIFETKEKTNSNTEQLAITNLKKETMFTKFINWIKRLKER